VEKAVPRHFRAKLATGCSRLLENKDTIQQRKHRLRKGPIHHDAKKALQTHPDNEPAEDELELQGNDFLEASVVLEGALHAIPEDIYQDEEDVSGDLPDIVKGKVEIISSVLLNSAII
jgi:hypothetical protein